MNNVKFLYGAGGGPGASTPGILIDPDRDRGTLRALAISNGASDGAEVTMEGVSFD